MNDHIGYFSKIFKRVRQPQVTSEIGIGTQNKNSHPSLLKSLSKRRASPRKDNPQNNIFPNNEPKFRTPKSTPISAGLYFSKIKSKIANNQKPSFDFSSKKPIKDSYAKSHSTIMKLCPQEMNTSMTKIKTSPMKLMPSKIHPSEPHFEGDYGQMEENSRGPLKNNFLIDSLTPRTSIKTDKGRRYPSHSVRILSPSIRPPPPQTYSAKINKMFRISSRMRPQSYEERIRSSSSYLGKSYRVLDQINRNTRRALESTAKIRESYQSNPNTRTHILTSNINWVDHFPPPKEQQFSQRAHSNTTSIVNTCISSRKQSARMSPKENIHNWKQTDNKNSNNPSEPVSNRSKGLTTQPPSKQGQPGPELMITLEQEDKNPGTVCNMKQIYGSYESGSPGRSSIEDDLGNLEEKIISSYTKTIGSNPHDKALRKISITSKSGKRNTIAVDNKVSKNNKINIHPQNHRRQPKSQLTAELSNSIEFENVVVENQDIYNESEIRKLEKKDSEKQDLDFSQSINLENHNKSIDECMQTIKSNRSKDEEDPLFSNKIPHSPPHFKTKLIFNRKEKAMSNYIYTPSDLPMDNHDFGQTTDMDLLILNKNDIEYSPARTKTSGGSRERRYYKTHNRESSYTRIEELRNEKGRYRLDPKVFNLKLLEINHRPDIEVEQNMMENLQKSFMTNGQPKSQLATVNLIHQFKSKNKKQAKFSLKIPYSNAPRRYFSSQHHKANK